MIEYKEPLPPANTIVLFNGGAGGNFLATMIIEYVFGLKYLNKGKTTSNDRNEYFNSNPNFVVERHLNLFFKVETGDKFGEEKFSLSRYREILRTYKHTKFIMIQSEEYIWLTKLLMDAKANTSPNFEIFEKRMRYTQPKNVWWYKDFRRINRHYNFFLKQLKRHGIQVLAVTYKELFLDINKKTIKDIIEFCVSVSDNKTEETLYNKFINYKQKNENLLVDYLQLPDDWSIDSV